MNLSVVRNWSTSLYISMAFGPGAPCHLARAGALHQLLDLEARNAGIGNCNVHQKITNINRDVHWQANLLESVGLISCSLFSVQTHQQDVGLNLVNEITQPG